MIVLISLLFILLIVAIIIGYKYDNRSNKIREDSSSDFYKIKIYSNHKKTIQKDLDISIRKKVSNFPVRNLDNIPIFMINCANDSCTPYKLNKFDIGDTIEIKLIPKRYFTKMYSVDIFLYNKNSIFYGMLSISDSTMIVSIVGTIMKTEFKVLQYNRIKTK